MVWAISIAQIKRVLDYNPDYGSNREIVIQTRGMLMQPNNFEFKNGYQMIPVAYAAVLAVVVGVVTHFFKIEISGLSAGTSSLITMVGVMLL